MWYAIADAEALGFELVPSEARDLCAAGEAIRVAAREQLSGDVSIVQLAGPWQGVVSQRSCHRTRTPRPVGDGHGPLRSHGDAARARPMRVGDTMTHASVIGSTFEGRIVAEVGEGIVPAIRGSAFITGRTELVVRSRSIPGGLSLEDTWPGDDLQS